MGRYTVRGQEPMTSEERYLMGALPYDSDEFQKQDAYDVWTPLAPWTGLHEVKSDICLCPVAPSKKKWSTRIELKDCRDPHPGGWCRRCGRSVTP